MQINEKLLKIYFQLWEIVLRVQKKVDYFFHFQFFLHLYRKGHKEYFNGRRIERLLFRAKAPTSPPLPKRWLKPTAIEIKLRLLKNNKYELCENLGSSGF
jgi:hypothetical protein